VNYKLTLYPKRLVPNVMSRKDFHYVFYN